MGRKTVSILLTNYNHAAYLPDSLGAICGQSRRADEIIIVDDGSTDDSVDVINSFRADEPRINLLTNDENRGVQYSIKRALAAATSDFVVWAAADDKLLPAFLDEAMAALETHTDAKICFSQLATFQDGSDTVVSFDKKRNGPAFDLGEQTRFLDPMSLSDRLGKSYLWLSGNTAVVSREAILEVGGFHPQLKWHSDWFSFYAVALRYGTCLIPQTLAAMRVLPETYSSSGMKDEGEQIAVLSEIADLLAMPEFADLRAIFRKRPCLFSPLGDSMLRALRRRPRDFDLYLRYLTWHMNHVGSMMRNQSRHNIPRKNAKKYAGLLLVLASRILTFLVPSTWKSPSRESAA